MDRTPPRDATPALDAASAVTWLFVPGDRPDRFANAAASGADLVILDLEDAVAPEAKAVAREEVCRWLAAGGHGWVRINAPTTPWYAGDLAALAGLPAGCGLGGIVLPKAEDPAELAGAADRLGRGRGVVALVETARGIHRAADLAATPGVCRLAFGSIDFAGDIGADGSWESLLHARSSLVLASRLGGLPGPVDGVTTALRDADRLAADTAAARALGCTGKLCIHPAQIAPVRDAFAPSADQLAWAERVLAAAAAGPGAMAVDGAMVDRPVVERARRILGWGST